MTITATAPDTVAAEAHDQPASDQPTVDQLLELTGRGDRRAFSQLYDRMSARVFGLARRILVDASLAEEVTQDVLLEVWQRASGFDPERGSAVAWMLRLTRSRAIDRVRESEARRARELRDAEATAPIAVIPVDELVAGRLEGSHLLEVVASLPPAEREAVQLAHLAGWTHREISERLSLPLGTVKTRLYQGLRRMRSILEAEGMQLAPS